MNNRIKIKKIILAMVILLFTCPAFSKNIAVIPFQNITGDKEKNWVGAGFAETLTTKIVKVKAITVIEREQLSKILEEIKFQYSGAVDEKTAVEKGKMYGADVMIFGSFQAVGEKLRVTARFVDVQTRKVIDTAEANGNISDIFKLQDEIAFNLMDSLKIVLAEKDKEEIKINPTDNLTAYQWFSKGIEAFNLKLDDKAIEYCTKAIELDKNYQVAYFCRGFAYENKGLYDEAILDFTKLIEINPIDAIWYSMRGLVYGSKGLYDESIKDYTKAIELSPTGEESGIKTKGETYYNRGIAYAHKDLYDDAIADFTRTIKINPKDAQAHTDRGLMYYNKSLYNEAIKDYNQAIQLDPKYANAYNNRGNFYIKKGLDDDAIKDYTKAIQLDPKFAMAYYNRGNNYNKKGLHDKAIEDCTRAIQINPQFADAYCVRGLAYAGKGLNDKATEDLKKAVDLRDNLAKQVLKRLFNIDY